MSTRQLAAELKVCERTVLRDIEALSGAGIPVYATQGRHGGFELLDGFTSRLARRDPPRCGVDAIGRGRKRSRGARTCCPWRRPARADPAVAAPAPARGAARPARPPGCTSAVYGRARPRPQAGPWIDAWVRIESPEAAVLDLLALGAEVEVVRPPALRAELARVARRIADLHSDGTAAP